MNAILIMCHKNIEQVKRLVNKCISNSTRIILHIDPRQLILDDELSELSQINGVYLTDVRIEGELDTRSLVDIAMEMINKAKEIEKIENIKFSYYLLLSGQDYLTKPIRYINSELEQMYPTPIIDCTPYDKNNWIYYKFCSNIRLRKINRWITNKTKKKSVRRKFLRVFALVCQKAIQFCHKTDCDFAKLKGIDLYGGSAWWILPDLVIDYIKKEYDESSEYVEFLLSTLTPEETFFQIMTMRSPCKSMVHINSKDMVAQTCKTWAYFSDVGKPFKGHPYIFTKDEYEKIINKDCWFARKFDITIDATIFDLLDEYLEFLDGAVVE